MIHLTLPMPPSVNTLFRNVPGRGRVKTNKYRAWLEQAGWEIKRQIPGHKTFSRDCAIEIIVERRGALDGRIKALLDLFTAMKIWVDDGQVTDLHITFGPVTGIDVRVAEIKPHVEA